jgi:hypothetical protein
MPTLANENRVLVLTTINDERHQGNKRHIDNALLGKYKIIVIGDSATPRWETQNINIDFFDLVRQKNLDFESSTVMPANHYARKNIGYLIASQNLSKWIVESDDDNCLYDGIWQLPEYAFESNWINPYHFFGHADIWARGIPLNQISKSNMISINSPRKLEYNQIACIQCLADGDPDLDAIGRILKSHNRLFSINESFILSNQYISPTNSQVTMWNSELLPLLYLPFTVSWRVSDIWRGFIAQIWSHHNELKTLYRGAQAFQQRNPHDLMTDFVQEIALHLDSEKVIKICKENLSESPHQYIMGVYKQLENSNLVLKNEIEYLEAYLYDSATIQKDPK